LDLERLKRGVVETSFERADVAELVRRVIAEADFLSERKVVVHADAVEASIDPAKVERILENLLVNAAKHTPDDSTIWVDLISTPAWVQINVEDEGAGVPQPLRTVIFEPFRRGSPETSSPGAGIGLSLVARFAALHGGDAWVEDREGGGASFRVRLPRDRSIAAVHPANRERAGTGS
jgi:signal transduction histidine kinase